MKFLILQHTDWAGPGRLLEFAMGVHNVRFDLVRVWRDWLPDFSNYDGIILLGGSPNVAEEGRYPFLVEEKRFIKRAVAADKPILAFCLGHQLLAEALGAKVGPNFAPSIGFVQGYLTHDGREHPAFVNLPKAIPLFKWHSQSVCEPLPKQLSLLATSAQCQVEAFSLQDRPHILGVQFDNHAAVPEDMSRWLENDWQWLASFRGLALNPAELFGNAVAIREELTCNFNTFFGDYLAIIS
ncbi:MAG: type 1 glutamine amidotransferase [Desulfobulbaceae bacterium]|nr:type 1 glutamine amidotransferase [Desulfobulbaceae bacterium]HIJ79139.1 type 1 glutamine amidotransferase [Deltaproteobacteria bacterium]